MAILNRIVLTLNILGVAAVWAGSTNHKAHVHGNAKLTLAMESDTKANVDLDVPADSIFGFEHKARTKKDQASEKAGLEKLRAAVPGILRFSPDRGCEFKVIKLGLEEEEKGEEHEEAHGERHGERHGEHEDVNLSYEVQCKQGLKGSSVQVGLIDTFSKIKKVSFQILTASGQSEKVVKSGKQSYRLD